MLDLTSPAVVKELMQRYQKRFKKSLGQNFLIDSDVLDAIVEKSGIDKDTAVLEIGPGIGALTMHLSQAAKKVVAVEIDSGLIPLLGETLQGCDNVELVNADILKTDIASLIEQKLSGAQKVKVAANLPYYITTPILFKLLEYRAQINSITVMVQKEVAERIVAPSGGKDYGALTVAMQFYTKPEIIYQVPAHSFMPMPKVDSAVIRLDILDKPAVDVTDQKLFFRVVRAAFAHRRKTFVNSASAEGFNKEAMANILQQCDFPADIRGERFSLQDFAKITEKLIKN